MKSLKDAQSCIQTGKDYHGALMRNGYFMPKFQSRICTEEFMTGVRMHKIFVPTSTSVVHHCCVTPPPVWQLKEELIKCLQEKLQQIEEPGTYNGVQNLVSHLQQRDADGPWLLNMLFYCTCEGTYPNYFSKHEFFKIDFVA